MRNTKIATEYIPLPKIQREIMQLFYSIAPTKILFDKKQRKEIWEKATHHEKLNFTTLKKVCPALEHQIQKSYKEGNNIQSAIFSECIYAQTYANMLNLKQFINLEKKQHLIPETIIEFFHSYNLFPEYVYTSKDKKHLIIPAGKGINNILIGLFEFELYTIEFKEPYAKTSEPDLPKYGEDGKLKATSVFLKKYPQFKSMLDEQKGLNFFNNIGNNIHNFSPESIKNAISNNYTNTKKYADVICTEDKDGYLVMMPSNQTHLWAKVEGEIRPAGRNHYNVWTPIALKKILQDKKAVFSGTKVSIAKSKLDLRKERGGAGKISGYKINSLFFVYIKDCEDKGTKITFDISKVQQLNPTIAAKMDFRGSLKYDMVKKYYQL